MYNSFTLVLLLHGLTELLTLLLWLEISSGRGYRDAVVVRCCVSTARLLSANNNNTRYILYMIHMTVYRPLNVN